MSRKRVIIILFLAVIAVLFWWLLNPSRQKETASTSPLPSPAPKTLLKSQQTVAPPPPTQPIEERRKAVVEKILGVLATPITFYGKVIDQNGDPVSDATVNYGTLDKFAESGSQYQGKSDANGNFSISGIHGAVLRAGVRKKGYYPIDGKSNGAFAYGIGPDSNSKPPPTKENPAVFILQKMGATEPLIQVSDRGYPILKNGTPVEVDLTTGRVSAQGNLRVETWTEDQTKDAKQHYNWRCRVSVPNGGLVERKGQFNFEAPIDGYKSSVELVSPPEKWSSRADQEYFVKLPDNRYARINFRIRTEGDHFFRLESYLNPKPGSRNLEFDPTKAVQLP